MANGSSTGHKTRKTGFNLCSRQCITKIVVFVCFVRIPALLVTVHGSSHCSNGHSGHFWYRTKGDIVLVHVKLTSKCHSTSAVSTTSTSACVCVSATTTTTSAVTSTSVPFLRARSSSKSRTTNACVFASLLAAARVSPLPRRRSLVDEELLSAATAAWSNVVLRLRRKSTASSWRGSSRAGRASCVQWTRYDKIEQ